MKCIACNTENLNDRSILVHGMDGTKDYKINFCRCGLGKTELEDSTELTKINEKVYNDLESRIHVYYRDLHNHLSIRYVQALRELEKHTNKRTLLEVGSNIGFTLNLARRLGFDASGCEINERCRKFSELVFDLRIHPDLFELNESFDIVIMNDVLEHFPEPDRAVRKLKDVLNDDGLVFIQLPNNKSSLAKKLKSDWDYYLVPDHTYHFSPESLTLFMDNNGFEKVWGRTASGIYDFPLIRMLPASFQRSINNLLNHSRLYHPGLYKRRNGELIQAIFRKK